MSTEHYSSITDLLNHYDANANGAISEQEARTASHDYMDDLITKDEGLHVFICCNHFGSIADYCAFLDQAGVCDTPTEHYSTITFLLTAYDTNSDGAISESEATQASHDYMDDLITKDEGLHVFICCNHFGSIANYCAFLARAAGAAKYLNVTPLSHNSPAAGESFEISVESNISWEAEDDVSWVSIQVSSECGDSPQYGCGDGIITATVDANPGTTSRTWHITVAGEGESRTRTYTQSGAAKYLNVTPLSHNSPAAGESFEISVESNISWDAADDVSWVSLSPTYGSDNGIITATVDANPGTTSRTWHVTVDGEGESRTRTYTQSGAPCSSYTNESSCIAAGCFWYGGACHEYGPVQCSDYTDGLTCVANNCYWWSDGTCHDTEEPVPGAKGRITLCNINALSCPNCGTAEEGTEIEVIAEMENEGGSVGKFRFYIYDQDGNELSKEPDLPFPFSYKSVEAGATWKVEKTLLTNLNFNMIAKDLNGELRLYRQT